MITHQGEADQNITTHRLDACNAGCIPAHWPGLLLQEAQAQPITGNQNDFVTTARQSNINQFIRLLELDGNNAVLSEIPEIMKSRLLHFPTPGSKKNESSILPEGNVISFVVESALKAQHCSN